MESSKESTEFFCEDANPETQPVDQTITGVLADMQEFRLQDSDETKQLNNFEEKNRDDLSSQCEDVLLEDNTCEQNYDSYKTFLIPSDDIHVHDTSYSDIQYCALEDGSVIEFREAPTNDTDVPQLHESNHDDTDSKTENSLTEYPTVGGDGDGFSSYQTDMSNHWRNKEVKDDAFDSEFPQSGLLNQNKIPHERPIRDWSALMEEDNFGTCYSNFPTENTDFRSSDTCEKSKFRDNSSGDYNPTDVQENKKPGSSAVRIRYTRGYLLKFADCIQAHAFPEALRKFTVTSELPLKQLEITQAQELRRTPVFDVYSRMDHIIFYNDMHFASNSRRALFKD